MTAPFTAETALQSACIEALRADGALKELLGGAKIYDEIPADAQRPAPPWIFQGPTGTQPLDAGAYVVWTVRIRFYCASVNYGRLEAWAVAGAARKVLHQADLQLEEGFKCQGPALVVAAGDVIDAGKPKEVFIDVEANVADDAAFYPPGA